MSDHREAEVGALRERIAFLEKQVMSQGPSTRHGAFELIRVCREAQATLRDALDHIGQLTDSIALSNPELQDSPRGDKPSA